MTISVHDLPPGNRPVDVVASNRQLPSLVPHKRELHKVSQPIEQAPQKYFFSFLFLPLDEMYQGRHGQLLEPALSELWSGGDGVHLYVGGQGIPFLRNAGYNSNIRLHCAVKYFCVLHAIQLSNANDSLEPHFCFYSQFHPEKNMFEWAPWHTSIPHSRQSQQSQSWSWLLSAVDVGVRNVFKATFYQGGHQRVALHGGVLCGGGEEEFPSVSLKVVVNQKWWRQIR